MTLSKEQIISYEKERESLVDGMRSRAEKLMAANGGLLRTDSYEVYDIDEKGIHYSFQYYCCGDTDYDSVILPWEAINLSGEEFVNYLEEVKAERKKKLEASERAKKAAKTRLEQKNKLVAEEARRAKYLKLKAEFEGM